MAALCVHTGTVRETRGTGLEQPFQPGIHRPNSFQDIVCNHLTTSSSPLSASKSLLQYFDILCADTRVFAIHKNFRQYVAQIELVKAPET